MTIIVCHLDAAPAECVRRGAGYAVSLLSPGLGPPPFDLPAARRLHLAFNDIAAPTKGLVHPAEAHVAALLAFFGQWDGRTPLLIHCLAGISRSTAAAYAAACLRDGPGGEARLAERLRTAAPFATPNPLMIALADRMLARDGAMIGAIAAIGRGAEAAHGTAFEL